MDGTTSTVATVQQFRELPFSAGLPDATLTELGTISQVLVRPAHTLLFREGEEHPWLYLLCKGSVALDMHVPGRGNVRILSLGAGDVLGWSPLVGDYVMTATAKTLEETRLIALAGDRLRELCEANHEIGYRFMRQMAVALSRRLVATRLQLLDLFAETTPGR